MSLTPTRRWVARGGTAAAALLAFAGGIQGVASAAPAHATRSASTPVTDPYSPAYHHPYRHGYVPTRSAAALMRQWIIRNRSAAAGAVVGKDSINNLTYGGGVDGIGVTSGHERVYLVFYGSQWGARRINANGDITLSGDHSGEAPYLQELLKGLGTNGEAWSAVMTQYCDGVTIGAQSCSTNNAEHVAYPSGGALAGVWADESVPSPKKASAHQLGLEAVKAAAHFGNTSSLANRDAQYVILSPTKTHPDGFNTKGGNFCAWHDYNGDPYVGVTSPYGDIAFTNMPYVTDLGPACGENFVNSGRAGTLDGVSIVEGHEYAETITDQNPAGGWTVSLSNPQTPGYETGDLCAWNPPGQSVVAANLTLVTGRFAMQPTWANDANGGTGACAFSDTTASNGDTVTTSNPGRQNVTAGSPVNLQIQASDSGSAALSYGATGLPPGLTIDPSTGVITGTPTTAGSYSSVIAATDPSNISGWATFTWTVSGQLLGNPGFEVGTIGPWKATSGVLQKNSRLHPSHSGNWLARLDGRRGVHTDTLSQKIAIGSNASSATLSFWLEIKSNDPTGHAYDSLRVRVLTPRGKLLKTLGTFSNRNTRGRYLRHSFSLGRFAGRTVVLKFTGAETLRHHNTAFLVDDTALNAS